MSNVTCSCEQTNVIKIVDEIIKLHQLVASFLNLEGLPCAFGDLYKLEKCCLPFV
jgi:hypothetical protein